MKVNEIERLLARYYDGETSDTEEKELKRFFTEEDVPAHLLDENFKNNPSSSQRALLKSFIDNKIVPTAIQFIILLY